MDKELERTIMRPIENTSRSFYVIAGVLGAIIALFAYAWLIQLKYGLSVTGMGDFGVQGGVPFGIYISTFIWWVGIAHGGIAVSAAIRLMKLDLYKPIARIAEVITPITLGMAGLIITMDLGRPDRVFNMIVYFPERIAESPLIWDITVVLTYFAFSVTYLLLTMRADLAKFNPSSKIKRLLYSVVLIRYHPDEDEKTKQMAWWLALALIVLMALLSGGVVPWLFGLMSSQPGWFGAVLGPYFLVAALASAMATVIFVSAIIRHVYKWHDIIHVDIFKGLSKAMIILILLYLWFMLHEVLTAQYVAGTLERSVSSSLLTGEFAVYFWLVVLGLTFSFIYLSVQVLRPSLFSLKRTVAVSLFVIILFWIKRFLIVIPALEYNFLPYPVGSYSPTWVEWAVVAGTCAITILGFMLFLKFFPAIELEAFEEEEEKHIARPVIPQAVAEED